METPEWLIELLDYLPLEDQEINDYVSKISSSISVNYGNGEYQLCFFAMHILFMTYIYTSVWKISSVNKDRYLDSSLFARPYNGHKLDFSKIDSVFQFSSLPEKDVFKFLSLIELDNGYIRQLCKLVDKRNNLAHATGNVIFEDQDNFDIEVKNYCCIIKKVNSCMEKAIRLWYERVLIDYSKNMYDSEYDETENIIQYEMIENFSLSLKELEICKNMSISKFSDMNNYALSNDEIEKIKRFHQEVKKNYSELAGIEE